MSSVAIFAVKPYRDHIERHRDLADAARAAGEWLAAEWHEKRAADLTLPKPPNGNQ